MGPSVWSARSMDVAVLDDDVDHSVVVFEALEPGLKAGVRP